MYNSCDAVENGIQTKSAHYIDEVNKWALIFKQMDGYINIQGSLKTSKSVSAEASIIEFLEEFDSDTSIDILYNVINTFRND